MPRRYCRAYCLMSNMSPKHTGKAFKLYLGDCLEVLDTLTEHSVDAVITDPPYELNFAAREWDRQGVAFSPDTWRKVMRVMKPGAHLAAFSGSRTSHRMDVAIEDAGMVKRDTMMWLYATGFPKSMNMALSIDKKKGVFDQRTKKGEGGMYGYMPRSTNDHDGRKLQNEVVEKYKPVSKEGKQFDGYGTGMAPAFEPISLFQKPPITSITECALKHGTGAINIRRAGLDDGKMFPKNVLHDSSDAIKNRLYEAHRYFYSVKATAEDRDEGLDGENHHPTVKPTMLMQWLVKLLAPPIDAPMILDPFMGSGSTGKAFMREHAHFIGIEREEEYMDMAHTRITFKRNHSLFEGE